MKKWNTFTKRIFIQKPLKSVYQCWTTQSKIEAWFLEKADFKSGDQTRKPEEEIQKGDHFSWKWNNWDFIEQGEILEANGEDLVSFTFGSGGIVEVTLNKTNGFTEVVLVQKDIPTDEESKMNFYVGCNTGWTFWLTNLKAYLEYGITLHAKGLQQNETMDLVNS